MVRFVPNRGTKVSSATMVGITEQGKDTVQHELARGMTFAILSMLNEHSPQSLGELTSQVGVPYEEMKERIRILESQGYLRYAGRRE